MANTAWMIRERDGNRRIAPSIARTNRRQGKKALQDMVLYDDEDADVHYYRRVSPGRQHVANQPMLEQWLASRIDQIWSDVCSQLASTVPANIRQAIIAEADKYVTRDWSDFSIDDKGRLCRELTNNSPRGKIKPSLRRVTEAQLKMWLNKRRIIERGGRLYWLEVTFRPIFCNGDEQLTRYRQSRQFNRDEYRFFAGLAPDQQESLLRNGAEYVQRVHQGAFAA